MGAGEKRPPGALAMFVGTMTLTVANFRRLLLWALPVPLYTLATAFLAGDGLVPSEDGFGFEDFPDPELGDAADADLDLPPISPLHALASFFGLLLGMPLHFGIQRHLLLGSPLGRPAYLRMFASRLVWRYAALAIGWWFALIVVLALAGMIAIAPLTFFATMGSSPEKFAVVYLMLLLLVWALAGSPMLRLSLAPALLACGEPHPLRRSWAVTRGGLLRLLGSYLLVFLLMLLLINLTRALLGGLVEQQILFPFFLVSAVLSFFWSVAMAIVPCQFLRTVETEPRPGTKPPGDSSASQ